MEAPKDTKVLLDLFEEAEDILSKNPDSTMMVHCSAGVGRTGTFIGLFKLAKDFNDEEVSARTQAWDRHIVINSLSQVEELDPFETVLTMRRQRTKMVQKPMQYNYMFRCLADYVAETTTEYI